MKCKRVLCAIGCFVAVMATMSCVDDRYDLDNISEDVHLFENGVSLPLLQSGDLYFDDLVSSEDEIVLNERGVYEFATNREKLSLELTIVDKVKVSEQKLNFGTIKSVDVALPSGSLTFDLPSEITSYNANIHVETATIDSHVTYIERVYTHDDWVSTIKFEVLDAAGTPISGQSGLKVDKIKFENYRLELPSVLIIDKENITASGNIAVTTNENSNILMLNGEVNSNEVEIGVKLKGLYIGTEKFVNNKIVIDEDVKIEGNISLSISNSEAATSQTLKIAPSVFIPEVYMDEALGNATLEDELENEKVYIGSLPEFLKSPETSLILTNPYIPIVIETTIPMDEVYADITLVPKDENGNDIFDDNGEKIEIKVGHIAVPGDDHDTPGPTINYEYVACQRIPELDNLGYDFVECENLGMVAKHIPAYIEVSGRGYTDPNHIYDFYLGEPYYADINYEVRIPFMLEENTKIIYSESITDLNTDLFEYISAKTIYAKAKILNGFPAEMALSVAMLDVNGDKIEGIEVVIPEKIKASKTTEITENVVPAETNMQIEIHELVPGQIQKIDRMDWTVEVLFPDKGVISKYQTLNMNIDLELPEGLDLNVDNL